MCLSTVYKNEKSPENVVLGNVMQIYCENGIVTLTDIMGREAKVEGEILSADPKAELIALMKYMVGHNAAHANELAQLAGKLKDMGENVAYDQVMLAVSDFEKGNMRLSTVLAALNV